MNQQAQTTPSRADAPVLSIVIPMKDEAGSLPALFGRLLPVLQGLGESFEVVCVDDGSTDATLSDLRAMLSASPWLRVVELSRCFGKEAALTAGLAHSRGQAVVPLDADLQDPPELIEKFVNVWRDGAEVAYGVRQDRTTDHPAKRFTARLFYRLINRLSVIPIPRDVGDFRLMDRRVVDAVLDLPERTRFMKGLFAWVGFRQVAVPYTREARAAGRSKFRPWRLWNFALEGIAAFSTAPLRIWTYVGLGVSALAIAYASILILRTIIYGRDVPGYASLMVVVLVLGGIQLITLGVLGEYLGRIFEETKRRPLYVVRAEHGAAATAPAGPETS
ncbi:MAG: glycosyltransferase family 2 protein [Alphaproteobacteria bacterium]